MTPRFLIFMDWLLPHECAFRRGHDGDMAFVTWENVDGDAGGVTKYGIDQRSHPQTDIKNLTLAQAQEIYWFKYWLPSLADHMPPGYGEVLCDIRVNGGDGPKMLQRALNLHDAGLTVDGVLGPKSVTAIIDLGEHGLKSFLEMRQVRYDRLADKPVLRKFLKGWTARNNDLAKFVGINLTA